METTAKAFYDMMSSAQKPLHDRTTVSQLDTIGRLMGFKSECSMSREHFDGLLTVIDILLLDAHILSKGMYESHKLLRRGASYLGKTTRMQIADQSVNPLDTWR
jgi:hypothetical protein